MKTFILFLVLIFPAYAGSESAESGFEQQAALLGISIGINDASTAFVIAEEIGNLLPRVAKREGKTSQEKYLSLLLGIQQDLDTLQTLGQELPSYFMPLLRQCLTIIGRRALQTEPDIYLQRIRGYVEIPPTEST